MGPQSLGPLPLVDIVATGCPSGVVPWLGKEVTLHLPHLFIYFKVNFMYLFFAALGLCCCAPALSSCGEWGYSLVAVPGLLTAVASLLSEHRL